MIMATELACGVVPPIYREFFDVVCANEDDIFDREMFVRILSSSGLSRQVLVEIWEAVNGKQTSLNRTGLYRSLALIALAQQGKSVNTKLLENYCDQELPKPDLGELSDLRTLTYVVRKERFPALLAYTYGEICEFDSVAVTLVPEKKGLILKHVEYEVSSQRWKTTVSRRYSDFLALQDVLLLRCPYRLIPRLPPKKVIGAEDRGFIEQRRRALQRFLTVVTRHPTLTNEHVVKYFFTFKGSELHSKIKEHFRNAPDEFMTSPFALKAKDIVSSNAQGELAQSREHIKTLVDVLTRTRDIAERMTLSAAAYAVDVNQLGKELSYISSDGTVLSNWITGGQDPKAWNHMKKTFRTFTSQLSGIVETVNKQAARLEERFADMVGTLVELLLAYKDLCERHDKGVLAEHQRTLQKLNQCRKKTTSTLKLSPTEPGVMEKIEARILEQESQIANVENRSSFALYCLQMETQLVYVNMEALYDAVANLADDERIAHCELGGAWAQVCPLLLSLLPSGGERNSSTEHLSTGIVRSQSVPVGHNLFTSNNNDTGGGGAKH